ncbi:hypothetical protein IPJ70_01700 [Candidatus Campbellbacteria bacterium]|nr:MAG: hypothetical protein IPJ70_01700 [Candidatus Campbellbacteria bacterium]
MRYYFRCATCPGCEVTKEAFDGVLFAVYAHEPDVCARHRNELQVAENAVVDFSSTCPMCSRNGGQSVVTITIQPKQLN